MFLVGNVPKVTLIIEKSADLYIYIKNLNSDGKSELVNADVITFSNINDRIKIFI